MKTKQGFVNAIIIAVLFFLFSFSVTPANASDSAIDAMLAESWSHFKAYKISPQGQVWADEDSSNQTVFSESQSYGMLRAVWSNDQQTFDRVWNWTKNNLQRKNIAKIYYNTNKWIN